MGRTLEDKQQIVEELKQLLGESEMALVLDYCGLSIKELGDLRGRLAAANSVCKVTKNTLMRRASTCCGASNPTSSACSEGGGAARCGGAATVATV